MKKITRCFVIALFLILLSCTAYHPSFFPSDVYDILNPGVEVQLNPIAWIEDNKIINDDGKEITVNKGIVVNDAFILWTYELKQEVIRLRKLVEEK